MLAPEAMGPATIGAELAAEAYPYVKSYFDAPKSLEDLREAAKSPEPGYDVRHIVERATTNPNGSEDELMNAPENLALIPTLKHWDLNGWYATKNPNLGNVAPRDFLEGKSWQVRREIGLMGLRAVGVLK